VRVLFARTEILNACYKVLISQFIESRFQMTKNDTEDLTAAINKIYDPYGAYPPVESPLP